MYILPCNNIHRSCTKQYIKRATSNKIVHKSNNDKVIIDMQYSKICKQYFDYIS